MLGARGIKYNAQVRTHPGMSIFCIALGLNNLNHLVAATSGQSHSCAVCLGSKYEGRRYLEARTKKSLADLQVIELTSSLLREGNFPREVNKSFLATAQNKNRSDLTAVFTQEAKRHFEGTRER